MKKPKLEFMKECLFLLAFFLCSGQVLNAQCTEVMAADVPLPVPLTGTGVSDCSTATTSVATVSGLSGTIGTEYEISQVELDISHTWISDLDIELISPDGTAWELSTDNGGGGEDYTGTIFQDGNLSIADGSPPFTGTFEAEAGPFAEGFCGETVNGDWTLSVCDDSGGDSGTLNSWSIEFCVVTTPPPPLGIDCPEPADVLCDGGGSSPASTGEATASGGACPATIDHMDMAPTTVGSGMVVETFVREWTATSGAESASCNQTITIRDEVAPVVTCPEEMTVECGDDTSPGAPGMGMVMAAYEGDPIPWLDAAEDGGTGLVATPTVEVAGVPAGATITDVNVSLDIDHSWVGDLDIELVAPDGSSTFILQDACGSSNNDNVSATFDDDGGPLDCGETTDNTNAETCNMDYAMQAALSGTLQPSMPLSALNGGDPNGVWTLNVNDGAGGDGGCFHNFSIMVEYTTPPTGVGAGSATDNCSMMLEPTHIDAFAPACGSTGTITRTWMAMDAGGNMGSCDQTIIIEDNTPPEITCPPDPVAAVECSSDLSPATLGMATVVEACNMSALTSNDMIELGACAGTYTILRTFTADDGCNPIMECTQTIEVEDSTPPVISCPPGSAVQCAEDIPTPIMNPVDFLEADGTISDNCTMTLGGFSVSHMDTDNGGAGCPSSPLVITRTYTVEDACENPATCPQTITVTDTEGPAAVCQMASYVLPESGSVTVVPADIFDDEESSDGCSGGPLTPISASPNAFDCNKIGDNTVTLTVEDACGNSSTCTATVTIEAGPFYTWYKDTDGDGYSSGDVIEACTAPGNYKLEADLTATDGDCNDSNPFVNPEAVELCNGIDDNCNNTIDENDITGISVDNIMDCNPATNTFTADVTVTFIAIAASGTLDLTGDGTGSVPVGSLSPNGTGGGSYTFMGVEMAADGGPISLSAGFSLSACAITNDNAGMAPESCLACEITDISVAAPSNCESNGNTDPSDDYFTSDVTVTFANQPTTGTLDLTGDGMASVNAMDIMGTSYTFPDVQMAAVGGPISLTASFSATECSLTDNAAGVAPLTCCFVAISEVVPTDAMCGGSGSLEIIAIGSGQLRYSIDGGATFQLTGSFGPLSPGTYNIVVQVNGGSCIESTSTTAEISTSGSPQVWYKDIDGDGYTDGLTLTQCTQPTGYVAEAEPGDCNDYDADEYPGQTWYADLDGDGHGSGASMNSCTRPTGHSLGSELDALTGDCDDEDATVNPGAPEICDGLDNDCDGMVDEGGGSGLPYMGSMLFDTQADVDAFSQCYSIIQGNMTIQGSVMDLSNLINIVEVTGNVHIKSSDLMSMGGLDNLATIGGYLKVRSNGMLATLDGLQGVTSVGGYLRVYYNGDLTDCCAIHDLLANDGVSGTVKIFRNETGCDDEEEVDQYCGGFGELMAPPSNGGIDIFASQNTDNQDVMIYPNPTSGGFNLRFAAAYTTASVQVYDLRGSLVLSQKEVSGTPSIRFEKGGLTSGIYLVKAIVDGEIFTQKLMVKE